MIKSKQLLMQIAAAIVLSIVLVFVLSNSITAPLLAQDCSAGTCDCECPSSACNAGSFRIPFSSVDVYACQCADGSESCRGIVSN